MSADRYLTVARVVRAHGLAGELGCEIITDYPQRFRRMPRVFLRPSTRPVPRVPAPGGAPPRGARAKPGKDVTPAAGATSRAGSTVTAGDDMPEAPREYAVVRARVVPHTRGAQVILHLEGIADREAADALRGWLVQVPEDEAWKLPKGQYYWHQIIGLDVVTQDGRRLGTVSDILETGANDVYVVKRDGSDLLLPAIKDVVKSISPERGEMVVELLPGME